MTDHDREPKQKTHPKKGKPVEIPIPNREGFLADLKKVARSRLDKRSPER